MCNMGTRRWSGWRKAASLAILMPVTLACAQATMPAASSGGGAGMEDTNLQQKLAAIAAAHQGGVGLFARQLNTGKYVALNADTPAPTASVIKLTILYEA